jgi:hypothetical protein
MTVSIRDLYRDIAFGPSPGTGTLAVRVADRQAFIAVPGASRVAVTAEVAVPGAVFAVDIALYLPPPEDRRPAVFAGPNFAGNASVDPQISVDGRWMRPEPVWGISANRATEATRGVHAGRWPLAAILRRGHAIATWYDGDFCRDDPALCRPVLDAGFGGAIAAWAWGFSRILDALADLDAVDMGRAAIVGHSRHGKAALWAAANDPRIALAIANNSGAGGARLFRHKTGETIADLFERFPHWFAPPLRGFAGREDELPFDQHRLIGLAAPRRVYVASAAEDTWAGPRGELEAARMAAADYAPFGLAVPQPDVEPEIDGPTLGDGVAYHLRAGGHGVTAHDWARWLDYADRVFSRTATTGGARA